MLPPFKGAKADLGSEFMGLDRLKFLEHYAYNLTLGSRCKSAILSVLSKVRLISHAQTKEILQNDANLKFEIAERLAKTQFIA